MNINEIVMHRYEGNPIIAPSSFKDGLATFNCAQIMKDGKYVLLLPVQKMNEQTPAIYYCESEDGINFTISDEPVITKSKKYPNLDNWPIDPRLSYIPEDDMYYLIRPMNSSWGTASLIMRSKDLKNWEEICVASLPPNRVPCLFNGKINGKYARLERPNKELSGGAGGNIWISYSDDLIHWGEYEPLLKGYTNWADTKIGPTPPIKTKYGWLEIFHGVKGMRYSLGAVLLDKDDPSKVIAKMKSPILTPNTPYEYNGHVGAVVFACGALVDEEKDEIRIYYGAGDCAIGLATGKFSELIDTMMYEDKTYDDWRWS